jgi:putative tryptophan/tyrosine transport system substrate-binding protein
MPDRYPSAGRRAGRAVALAVLGGLLAALTSCGSGTSDAAGPIQDGQPVRVGVLQIAQAALLDSTVARFQERFTQLAAPRQVTFDVQNAGGDQSLVASITRNFARSDYDMFAVIGTPAVVALAHQVTDRPVIAIAMGDPVGAGVAQTLDRPGGNITGSTDYVEPAALLPTLQAATPRPARIGTVFDPSNQNMAAWTQALHAAARDAGLEIVDATISGPGDVSSAARSLVGRADAVLIGPDATVVAGLDAVGAVAAQAHLPTYVIGGEATTAGILASLGPDYAQVGAQAAEAAMRVLHGTPPAEVPFTRPQGVQLEINGAVQAALGTTFPPDVQSAATVR